MKIFFERLAHNLPIVFDIIEMNSAQTSDAYITNAVQSALNNLPEYVNTFAATNNITNDEALQFIQKKIIDDLSNIIKTPQAQVDQDWAKIKNLEGEVNFIKKLYASEQNDVKQKYNDFNNQITACNQNLRITKEQLEAAQKSLQDTNDKILANKSREEIQQLTLRINSLSMEKETLKLQLQEAMQSAKNNLQSQDTIQLQNVRDSQYIKDLFTIIQQNDPTLANVSQDNMIERLRNYLRQSLQLQQNIDSLNEQLATCRNERLDFSRVNFNYVPENNSNLESRLNEVMQNYESLQEKFAQGQNALANITQQYNNLNTEHAAVISRNSQLQAQITDLQETLNDNRERLKNAEDDLVNCTTDLNSLQTTRSIDAQNLQQSQDNARLARENLEKARLEHTQLQDKCNQLQLEYDRLMATNENSDENTVSEEILSIQQQYNNARRDLEDIETQLVTNMQDLKNLTELVNYRNDESNTATDQVSNDAAQLADTNARIQIQLNEVQDRYNVFIKRYAQTTSVLDDLNTKFAQVEQISPQNQNSITMRQQLNEERKRYEAQNNQVLNEVQESIKSVFENLQLKPEDREEISKNIESLESQHEHIKKQLDEALNFVIEKNINPESQKIIQDILLSENTTTPTHSNNTSGAGTIEFHTPSFEIFKNLEKSRGSQQSQSLTCSLSEKKIDRVRRTSGSFGSTSLPATPGFGSVMNNSMSGITPIRTNDIQPEDSQSYSKVPLTPGRNTDDVDDSEIGFEDEHTSVDMSAESQSVSLLYQNIKIDEPKIDTQTGSSAGFSRQLEAISATKVKRSKKRKPNDNNDKPSTSKSAKKTPQTVRRLSFNMPGNNPDVVNLLTPTASLELPSPDVSEFSQISSINSVHTITNEQSFQGD